MGVKIEKNEIVNQSIRLPRSLKEKTKEKAKEEGFRTLQGGANFSAYVRWLLKQNVEKT